MNGLFSWRATFDLWKNRKSLRDRRKWFTWRKDMSDGDFASSLLIAIEPKINSWSNDRARAGWTRGGGTSVIPGGLGAQAPRYRGTPRREELTRVPHRTAHTAHQLIQRTSAGSSGDLQISRGPRGRNSGNKRSARLPEKRSGNGRSVGRASHPSITSIVTSGWYCWQGSISAGLANVCAYEIRWVKLAASVSDNAGLSSRMHPRRGMFPDCSLFTSGWMRQSKTCVEGS